MIQIQVFGTFLDLKPGTDLSMSIRAPMFSTDYIAGSLSYDLELPFTPINNQLLNFTYDESVKEPLQTAYCTVYLDGIPYKDAKLNVKTVNEKGYICYLTMDAGLLRESLAEKDLSLIGMPLLDHSKEIGSATSYPFIRLRLTSFLTTKRALCKLNIYRDIAGVPTLTHQFQVFYNTDKTTTLNAIANQINNKNENTHVWPWVPNKKYHVPTDFTTAPATATFWLNKFWFVPAGQSFGTTYGDRIFKFISPDNYATALDPATHSNSARINYQLSSYNAVDEALGNPNNPNDLKATVFGDEILIEDQTNSYPYHLSITGNFGPNWTLVSSDTDPVIAGVDQSKIAAVYEATMVQTWPTAKFACAPVRNEKFLDIDLHPEFQKYQNNIDRDSKLILNSNTSGSQNKNVFTAFPYVAHILESIFKMGDLKLFGAFLNDAELLSLCIWNNFSNDMVLVDEANPLNQLRVPSPIIDLNQNLKGTKITDFLYALRKTFGLDFVYKVNGSVEVKFKRDIALSLPAKDWSQKEVMGTEIYIEDEINGYTFKNSTNTDDYYESEIQDLDGYEIRDDVNDVTTLLAIVDDPINVLRGVLTNHTQTYTSMYRCTFKSDFTKTWVFFGKRLKNVIVGDGENEVTSEIGVPLMYYLDEATTNRPRWRLVRVDAEGRSLFSLEEQKDPSGLKFMFYGNYVQEWRNPDSSYAQENTPTFRTVCQDLLYPTPAFNYSLNIVGEVGRIAGDTYNEEALGTYYKFWQDWVVMMLNARKMQKKFLLTQNDIRDLDPTEKVYSNGKSYLFDKLDFQVGDKDTIIATVDCWRL
jgi:hypothetical protein